MSRVTSPHRILQPPGWPRPRGYANGLSASGRLVVTAGIVGWDANERFPAGLAAQFERVLQNTLAILAEAGAMPEHVVRMTWYILNREEYLAEASAIGAIWRSAFGRHYPAMAVVEVAALMEADALIEIETMAVVPFEP